MEKQTRDFDVNFEIDWMGDTEIKKIREDLDALEALGATHVYLEPKEFYDTLIICSYAFARRVETDEEIQERAAHAKELAEAEREKELEQLAMLKAKYEK